MNSKNNETLVCALGGLGEVGKNMYVVMHEEELFVIEEYKKENVKIN